MQTYIKPLTILFGMAQTIATFASHSSLQILHGAKQEGFSTLLICKSQNVEFYHQYPFVDKIVVPRLASEIDCHAVRLLSAMKKGSAGLPSGVTASACASAVLFQPETPAGSA